MLRNLKTYCSLHILVVVVVIEWFVRICSPHSQSAAKYDREREPSSDGSKTLLRFQQEEMRGVGGLTLGIVICWWKGSLARSSRRTEDHDQNMREDRKNGCPSPVRTEERVRTGLGAASSPSVSMALGPRKIRSGLRQEFHHRIVLPDME